MQKSLMWSSVLALSVFMSLAAQAAVKIEHWQTSQGADVYFVENHELPIVDVSTNFPAGSSRDDAQRSGLASMTRYLMTLGAAGLKEDQIAQQMADIGAQLGGDFDVDRSSLKLRTLSRTNELEKALSIYTKILHAPDFPQEVVEREKTRIIAGLEEAATQPESIASKVFMQALYPNHPYALEESGEPETVQGLKREDMVAFYSSHYGAKGATVAMIGDLTRAQAEAIAERISSGLPKAPLQQPIAQVTTGQKGVEQRIQHPASQSHILLGTPGVKRGDADYFPLYVGNYILGGGGFVSRLTEEVREKRGLVYSVYSYFMTMAELGPFQVGLQTKKEQANEALDLVRNTLRTFIDHGVTEAELKAAKQNIVGGFPLRLDSNNKILDYLSVIGFYKLPLTYLEDFNTQVSAVTAKQIQEAFKRRIHPDQFVTVIVGDSQ